MLTSMLWVRAKAKAILGALGGTPQPLVDAIAAGTIRGAVAVVGCNNPKVQQDYGHVISLFMLAYAIMYAGSGPICDRLGTRKGFAVFITLWSLAAVGIVSAVVQGLLMGRLLRRFSPRRLAVLGLLSSTLAFIAWGAATFFV